MLKSYQRRNRTGRLSGFAGNGIVEGAASRAHDAGRRVAVELVVDRVRMAQHLYGEQKHQQQASHDQLESTFDHQRSLLEAICSVYKGHVLSTVGSHLLGDRGQGLRRRCADTLVRLPAQRGFLRVDLHQRGAVAGGQ